MTQHIAVIGAGITGITTAYALAKQGYDVTVFDKNRYPAMETSFANGGQLSACNAEVWNSTATVLKGLKWMLKKDAPLLLNPSPTWHKYSWLAQFLGAINSYESNTIQTAKLAIAAREHLFQWAKDENINFDLEERGILHVYQSKKGFEDGIKVSALLAKAGLERQTIAANELKTIEPTLTGSFYGGFYTPSDSTGDIHKFTRGLAQACERLDVKFMMDTEIENISPSASQARIDFHNLSTKSSQQTASFDGVVICAGVGSRALASMVGDNINIYPVKGYSITVHLEDETSQKEAPWVSLLDEEAKIVTSRLGSDRLRVAGTAEYNGDNLNIRADRTAPLTHWVRANFGNVNTDKVVPWAGLRPMMPNMMPRIQKGSQPGIYYNTGHGHLGWTLSAITAQMLTELLIQDKPN